MLPRGLVAREDVGGVVAVVTLPVCATLLGCKGATRPPQQRQPRLGVCREQERAQPVGAAQAKDSWRGATRSSYFLLGGALALSNEGGPERLVIRLSIRTS